MTVTVTPERWARAERHGYTHRLADGSPAMLMLDDTTGATVLQAVTVAAPRLAWVDRLRGLAILLMVADHALALDGGHWLLRHSVLRLSLPLFMVTAAMVWKPSGPSSRRTRQLAAAALAEVALSTVLLRLDGPGPVALYALVLVIVAPRAVHTHPGCVAVVAIVQALYLPIPWAGYQPGLLVAYWCVGRLARDELAGLPLGWLPGFLGAVGRRPLAWYTAHLAVLAAASYAGLL